MNRCFGKSVIPVLVMWLLLALTGGVLASQAVAAPVESATLTMSSDAGDYIGGGREYSYDTSAGDAFGSTSSDRAINVNVQGGNGDWWYLDFVAPQGQTLAVGTYDGATRYPFQDPSDPGLSVSGNGAGCNTLTGSFTVTQITFGSGAELKSFDADFEQHCEGAEAALRGHVHVVNAPAPPPLVIGIGLAAKGVADRESGTATVKGTVTCSTATTIWLQGMLTQRANRFSLARGDFNRQIACSGTTPWQATVQSSNSVPFGTGSASLTANAFAFDSNSGTGVEDTATATVKLGR